MREDVAYVTSSWMAKTLITWSQSCHRLQNPKITMFTKEPQIWARSVQVNTRLINDTPGALCNMRHPSETHLKLKTREISFVYKISFSWQIVINWLHRAQQFQQYQCRLLCKISNRFGNCEISYGQTSLREIWVLRYVSDGYPIVHRAQVLQAQATIDNL